MPAPTKAGELRDLLNGAAKPTARAGTLAARWIRQSTQAERTFDELCDALVEAHEAGASVRRLAAATDLPPASVHRWILETKNGGPDPC